MKRRRPGFSRTGVVSIASIASVGLIMFFFGYLANEEVLGGKVRLAWHELWSRFRIGFQNSELPLIRVDMKFKHYLKIEEKRREARASNLLISSSDDYVPAELRVDGRTIPVKMRLKGDWTDHLRGHKWSYRVKVKGDESLFGMRVFSLQHPRTRTWEAERLFQETLRREGVLGLRYQFVQLEFNGKKHGIYALEEHFSKELLESQRRREGVIIKPDESGVWSRKRAMIRGGDGFFSLRHEGSQVWPITAFQSGKIEASPELSSDRDVAVELLRRFNEGELPASRVFKVDLLARFVAISELWSASHGLISHNLRFYYDPVEGLLEPIGFDGNALGTVRPGLTGPDKPWVGTALRDPIFAREYVRELNRISKKTYVRSLREALEEDWQTTAASLRVEWPDHDLDPWSKLERRRTHIRKMLELEGPVVGRVFPSLLSPTSSPRENPVAATAIAEVRNTMKVPIEVLGFRSDHLGFLPVSENGEPAVLARREDPFNFAPQPGRPDIGRFALSQSPAELEGLVVVCRLLGSERESSVPLDVLETAIPEEGSLPESEDPEDLTRRHPFLTVVEGSHRFDVLPGDWSVEGDLVLPVGFSLYAGPGTTLRFDRGAVALVRGELHLAGSQEAPVRLIPKGEEPWAGLAVLRSGASTLVHVDVVGTSEIRRPGWRTTGGITFCDTAVVFDRCRFQGSRGEDAVNVIRGEVVFKSCEFSDTVSDAFDGDFVVGEITQSRFSDIGGDAIDVSGSRVELGSVEVFRVADKALSAGEESQVTVSSLHVEGAVIAVASKDLSEVEIEELVVRDAEIGVAAYTKKNEYGRASIAVVHLSLENVKKRALAQRGSDVSIENSFVPGEDFDVDQLYVKDEAESEGH